MDFVTVLLLFALYLAWGADNHDAESCFFFFSIVAIPAFSTVIGLGMGRDWIWKIWGEALWELPSYRPSFKKRNEWVPDLDELKKRKHDGICRSSMRCLGLTQTWGCFFLHANQYMNYDMSRMKMRDNSLSLRPNPKELLLPWTTSWGVSAGTDMITHAVLYVWRQPEGLWRTTQVFLCCMYSNDLVHHTKCRSSEDYNKEHNRETEIE